MRWLLGALVVVLCACSTTPTPETTRRSEPTTTAPTTSTAEPPFTDEQLIRAVFRGFGERVNSGDAEEAMFTCTFASYPFAELLQHHAWHSTEAQLAPLPTLQRLLVYALRHVQPPTLWIKTEAGALEAVLKVSNGFVAPADLTGLTITGTRATATAAQPGTDPIPVTLVRGATGNWALDFPALVGALGSALDQLAARRNLTPAQLVDQVLANRFGAARAAELRTPLK